MVYPGNLFHRRQRGIPMHPYENRGGIRALHTAEVGSCTGSRTCTLFCADFTMIKRYLVIFFNSKSAHRRGRVVREPRARRVRLPLRGQCLDLGVTADLFGWRRVPYHTVSHTSLRTTLHIIREDKIIRQSLGW
jgi:hypothetical protein